jgi:hypothetical protein
VAPATAARTARVGTLHDGRRWPSTESEELLMRKQSALFAFAALALCYGAASAQEQMPVQHDAPDAPAFSQATSPSPSRRPRHRLLRNRLAQRRRGSWGRKGRAPAARRPRPTINRTIIGLRREGAGRVPRRSEGQQSLSARFAPSGRGSRCGDLARSAFGTAVDAGRAFSIVALGKRAPMPYVWLRRRATSALRNRRSGRPTLPRKTGGSA